jgi:hypothetical protein
MAKAKKLAGGGMGGPAMSMGRMGGMGRMGRPNPNMGRPGALPISPLPMRPGAPAMGGPQGLGGMPQGGMPPSDRGGLGGGPSPYSSTTTQNIMGGSQGLGGMPPGGMGMKKGGAVKKMASGGSTSSASKRGDGIASKGKTNCKMY